MDRQIANIIERLGGAYKVAEIVNKHPSRVYRWTYEKPRGTGGIVQNEDIKCLMEFAEANEIELQYSEFFEVSGYPPSEAAE
ncbi:MAG: hypothetical protein ABJL33_15390 [Hyphomicrobiales bacterium]